VLLTAVFTAMSAPDLEAQRGRGGPQSDDLREATAFVRARQKPEALQAIRRELARQPTSTAAANLLDTIGEGTEARRVFQRQIDEAADPAARAAAERAMAMSYAFEGDCANTIEYEQRVIDYWVTREAAEPQNAFYQQGEMANEGARVCIDAGDLDTAETWYRKGTELGLKEPEPKTHPKSLWDYRLAHALGRIAARRGDAAEAARQIAAARQALDGDPAMAEQQERFFPYLVGYVALYTNDLAKAQTELERAIAMPGNGNDPFLRALLGMTYEKLGRAAEARAAYEAAYERATAHNPPAAFTRPFARAKLGW
jgi:tetratricopeptide (TPR) repeat protein